MSKKLTEEELSKLINKAKSDLDTFINDLKKDPSNEKSYKRATLIAYWIIDYIKMLREEKKFDSTKLLKYNRGDIVCVNFGYRIGSELGGRHFAVVLDCNNSMKSNVVTVAPLGSKKKGSKNDYYSHELKHGLCELHDKKFALLADQCNKEVLSLTEQIDNTEDPNYSSLIKKKISKLLEKLSEAKELQKSMKKLAEGTIVNLGQIVTVSKIRITNPKKSSDSLCKIKVQPEDLDCINSKLINLYLPNIKPSTDEVSEAFINGINS